MYEFTLICQEPTGPVTRTVRPLEQRAILPVWQRMRESLESRGRTLPLDLALREFGRLDKLFWTVDDVGLLIADSTGDTHVFFWDGRLRGREELCKAMAYVTMEIFELEETSTRIPESEKMMIAFAKRVGYTEEFVLDGVVHLRLRR